MKTRISKLAIVAVVGCAMFMASCKSPPVTNRTKFDSWDTAIGFLQKRHRIPDGEFHREQCKRDSVTRDVEIADLCFRLIALDYRGESKVGIRGQNGPLYVFLRSGEHYTVVGGFLGSRMDVLKEGGGIVTKVYTHISAWETPADTYPFRNGVFNVVDPNVQGDVFK